MAGALKHTQQRLQTLCQQKTLLSRRLAEREVLEEEVRRLAGALGSDEDEEEEDEEEGRRRAERSRAVRRWRRSVCVVLAVRRWRVLAQQTAVLFRVEVGGGGPAVCVCGGATTATQKGQDSVRAGGRSPVCKLLMDVSVSTDKLINCLIVFQLKMTMMMMMMMKECALAGCALNLSPPPFCPPCPTCRRRCHTAVTHVSIETAVQLQFCHHDGSLSTLSDSAGSSPPDVMSASRSALSRLLDHLLNQSEVPSSLSHCTLDKDTLSGRLRLGLSRLTPPQPNTKVSNTLVSLCTCCVCLWTFCVCLWLFCVSLWTFCVSLRLFCVLMLVSTS